MHMALKEIWPHASLASFVRLYRIVDFEFDDDTPVPPKVYPPRPEQCIQFCPTPSYMVYAGSDTVIRPKNAFIQGQHTTVNYRYNFRRLLTVQAVFQPGALFRLLGMPQTEILDQLVEAEDILGPAVAHVNEQIFEAKDHATMIAVVEKFLHGLIRKYKKDAHPMDVVMQHMLQPDASQNLDYFVDRANLSHRQFDRKFIERAGVGAKEFLRVVRFYKAYLLKNRYPDLDWLSIALHCDCHDYQHLTRDYKDFTGYTPAQFFALGSPERTLGSEEVY
ncbi:helix-turn-helix domain-containing protein [Chryseolinea lacunae]|uniref:AraC family transcriptional regulator n=1 Tax=Chryseolinea lacunae TaxID=2801331 RepID=A0ABS1KLP5_9BACT|nr:helix-turn-helix domain-containing protein [Chryseolinea lacunae]MBL0740258.1 AraC family transcriptional regulator [Chryseolinea lacunae]